MKDSESLIVAASEEELDKRNRDGYRAAFADLDASAVDLAASRLLLDGKLGTLPENHPLRNNDDSSEVAYRVQDVNAVAENLAAAAFGHQFDSWGYLGAAVRAVQNGESSIAKHLLYYSELRSAFAILARHGILIRSTQHVALTRRGVRLSNKVGTHVAVWDALKRWSRTTAATKLFLDLPQLSGVPLSSWLAEAQLQPTATMQELFRDIGYDLSRFEVDRVARNSASYGPRWLREPTEDTIDAVDDLPDLWKLVRPFSDSGFEEFDAQYVAIVVARARGQAKQSVAERKYLPWGRATAEKLGAAQPETAARTLSQYAKPGKRSAGMRHAFDANPPNDDLGQTRAMLGRAFVLARFASGAIAGMVRNAAITDEELDPWFLVFGGRSGLWDMSEEGVVRDDLIQVILEAGEVLTDARPAPVASLRNSLANELDQLSRFPLLGTWIVDSFERPMPAA